MININMNESKNIEFDVSISGTEMSAIKGHLRLIKDGMEYGIPTKIIDNSIQVDIPRLDTFIISELKNGEKISGKLELIVNGDTYIMPWEDSFVIEKPMVIEAKVKEIKTIETKSKPKISIGKIFEKSKEVPPIVKKEPTKKSKFGKTLE